MQQPETVGLLRALERQFAALSQLATGKALAQPDTSFTHYRKLGEATGLHTAWRLVADLADQVAEGRGVSEASTLPPLATAGESADPADDLVAQVGPPAGAAGAQSK